MIIAGDYYTIRKNGENVKVKIKGVTFCNNVKYVLPNDGCFICSYSKFKSMVKEAGVDSTMYMGGNIESHDLDDIEIQIGEKYLVKDSKYGTVQVRVAAFAPLGDKDMISYYMVSICSCSCRSVEIDQFKRMIAAANSVKADLINNYGIESGKTYKGKYLVLGMKEIGSDMYVTYANTSNDYRDIVTIDQFIKHIATVVA